jgi:hypothetical protein
VQQGKGGQEDTHSKTSEGGCTGRHTAGTTSRQAAQLPAAFAPKTCSASCLLLGAPTFKNPHCTGYCQAMTPAPAAECCHHPQHQHSSRDTCCRPRPGPLHCCCAPGANHPPATSQGSVVGAGPGGCSTPCCMCTCTALHLYLPACTAADCTALPVLFCSCTAFCCRPETPAWRCGAAGMGETSPPLPTWRASGVSPS